VWLELRHVSGEVWRFRRVGQRLQARLYAAERDLLSERSEDAPGVQVPSHLNLSS
jgi:hypothetical protein